MLEELKIDPEFEKVIPPLTKDEYHQLEIRYNKLRKLKKAKK